MPAYFTHRLWNKILTIFTESFNQRVEKQGEKYFIAPSNDIMWPTYVLISTYKICQSTCTNGTQLKDSNTAETFPRKDVMH